MGDKSEAIVPSLEALREAEAAYHDSMIDGGEIAQLQAMNLRQAGRNAIRAVKLDNVGRSEMQAVQTLRSDGLQLYLRGMRELHEQTFYHLQTSVRRRHRSTIRKTSLSKI